LKIIINDQNSEGQNAAQADQNKEHSFHKSDVFLKRLIKDGLHVKVKLPQRRKIIDFVAKNVMIVEQIRRFF
jgi:hypothetical protein